MDDKARIVELLSARVRDWRRIVDMMEDRKSTVHGVRDGRPVDTTPETIAYYRKLIAENEDVIARMEGGTLPESQGQPTDFRLELAGSYSGFESEFETGRTDRLSFRAPADRGGLAVYGPYIDIPAGHFRFEMLFEIEHRAPGVLGIDLCDLGADRKYYARSCFAWELDAGLIAVAYNFTTPTSRLEMRLRVPPAFSGALLQLRISPWTPRLPI
jgi:hypothetical protein